MADVMGRSSGKKRRPRREEEQTYSSMWRTSTVCYSFGVNTIAITRTHQLLKRTHWSTFH